MKIAIGVHGRFHAFDLARALAKSGHDVTLFTNYPVWATRPFDLGAVRVVGASWHGLLTRALQKAQLMGGNQTSRRAHHLFAVWLALRLKRQRWDATYTWSGVSGPWLAGAPRPCARLLARGSSHIVEQQRILSDEAARLDQRLDVPLPWAVEAEVVEYSLADGVVVLSDWCRETFLRHGHPADRVFTMVAGAYTERFAPSADVTRARLQRVAGGAKLTVLSCGTFSHRKGGSTVLEIFRRLAPGCHCFHVGEVAAECRGLEPDLRRVATVLPRVPQAALPDIFAKADIVLAPSLEEGFPGTSAQAVRAGLAIVTTAAAAGDHLTAGGQYGYLMAPHDASSAVSKILQWDQGRAALLKVLNQLAEAPPVRGWDAAADDWCRIANACLPPPMNP